MTKSIGVFMLALACSAPAFAQVSTSTSTQSPTPYSTQTSIPTPLLHHREWEGSFYAGYSFHQDYNFRTVIAGRDDESLGIVGMHYESGYRLGARATQNLGDYFAATLEYGFSDQNLRLTNVAPRAPNLNLSHFVHTLTYNVAFSPLNPYHRFRPYIEIGTGASLFHIAQDSINDARDRGIGLEDSWEVLFNYGIGFKHLVADRYALMVDVHGRMSDIPTYGLPKSARFENGQFQPAISAHGLMHAWQLNVGFARQWDSW